MRLSVLLALIIPLINGYSQRIVRNLAEIPGYITLTADLHVHTVFSDGQVWPTFRVDEAVNEGIDIISLTDHIEYLPHSKHITASFNAPYEEAIKYASQRNIILIKAVEITRPMPTGHYNVLFLKDADKLKKDNFLEVMEEAIKQGAFIFWNHPGWKTQQPDGNPKFYPIQQELLTRKWLHGIEYYNTKYAYGFVLDWCKEQKLTVLGNSDVHVAASDFWDFKNGGKRPVTLIFAKERTESSVKEALFAGRTLALNHGDSLAGTQEWAEKFFLNSIQVKPPHFEDSGFKYIEIQNKTDIPFHLQNINPETEQTIIVLKPNSATMVKVRKDMKQQQAYSVKNILIGDKKPLEIKLTLIK